VSVAAIEINDASVLTAVDGVVRQASPGYALLSVEPPAVGEEALRLSRAEPLSVNNQFWDDLDERPMIGRLAAGRSHADLAYLHLGQLWSGIRDGAPSVRGVVPATFRAAQLALFLGVAREAGMPVEGFVDTAVAAAATLPGSGRLLHVDLHLHKAVITAVAVGEGVRRERSEAIPGVGWIGFLEAWLRMIAREFITETRFDPLHQADTEQQLFERLPSLLEHVGSNDSVDVEMSFGAETHTIRLAREHFMHQADPLYSDLLMRVHRLRTAGHQTTIALTERAALLPGLVARLAEFNDCTVVRAAPGVSVRAACALGPLWQASEDSVQLLTAAPRIDADVAASFEWTVLQEAQRSEAVAAPTHVLYRGQAIALGSEPLVIGLAPIGATRILQVVGATAGVSRVHCSLVRTAQGVTVIDHSRYGTWLNDEAVVGRAPLRAGDRLRLGRPGVTLELIASE
jgi:hypothetical protein